MRLKFLRFAGILRPRMMVDDCTAQEDFVKWCDDATAKC
jgi:hypothetical protein